MEITTIDYPLQNSTRFNLRENKIPTKDITQINSFRDVNWHRRTFQTYNNKGNIVIMAYPENLGTPEGHLAQEI